MKTNIYPIQIEFEEYQMERVPYSDERLADLRAEHNHTHSFFRNGDYIYVSNKAGDSDIRIGDTHVLSTYGDWQITSSLLKHLFFRTFKERFPTIIPTDFYPFRIFSTQDRHDYIKEFLPDSLKGVVSYKRQVEAQIRLLERDDKEYFGLILNVQRRWLLQKNCKDLLDEEFHLVGKEVLHSEVLPGLNDVLAPNEEFLGIVDTIDGDFAHVKTNLGMKKIALNELVLRKSYSNIQEYLAHCTSVNECERIMSLVKNKRTEFLDPKREYNELGKIARMLSTDKGAPVVFLNKDGFCFSINHEPVEFQQSSFELKEPVFVFDPAGNQTDKGSPGRGLDNFGPYDSINFDRKSAHVVAFCLKQNRGGFSNFIAQLFHGMPNSSYFKKGLIKKYDLNEGKIDIVDIDDYDIQKFEKVISNLNEKPDLIIVEIPARFKSLDTTENPYYILKARFLALEIPVQFVMHETVANSNEYILGSIALQIYAKIGGTPWVLTSSSSMDREIIIGVGHSIMRSNSFRDNEKKRVVGISTFFSGDGQYLLSNKAKDVPYDQYFDELLSNLRDSITRLKDEQGWRKDDTIRLIFHIFKPIKDVEFEVVSKLIKEFDEYRIQFAFVTVSKFHPYMVFNPLEQGIKGFNGVVKGNFVPKRATNFVLDSSSCLLQMVGPKEIKTKKHGASPPVLIRIRKPQGNIDSDSVEQFLFTDLHYITQQIYSFSYLSWRGFLPGEYPATMLYSNLIAKLLGQLRKIDGWTPGVLNFKLKRKKWFL